MSRASLVATIASETSQSKRSVERVLALFLGEVATILGKGKKVTLGGFGTFRVRRRKARTGRNPRTGERITIDARRVVGFKAGARLRRAIR
ncbi:MAG: HU family DNA-binding protein [Acidobacteriota bacterium]